jgi:hypothetical protein
MLHTSLLFTARWAAHLPFPRREIPNKIQENFISKEYYQEDRIKSEKKGRKLVRKMSYFGYCPPKFGTNVHLILQVGKSDDRCDTEKTHSVFGN